MAKHFRVPDETFEEVNKIAQSNGLTIGAFVRALLFAIKEGKQELFYKFFTNTTKQENEFTREKKNIDRGW